MFSPSTYGFLPICYSLRTFCRLGRDIQFGKSQLLSQQLPYCSGRQRAPWEGLVSKVLQVWNLMVCLHSTLVHFFPRHAKPTVASSSTKWGNLVHFLKLYYWCLLWYAGGPLFLSTGKCNVYGGELFGVRPGFQWVLVLGCAILDRLLCLSETQFPSVRWR